MGSRELRVLTITQAAEELGCRSNPQAVNRLVEDGLLEALKVDGRACFSAEQVRSVNGYVCASLTFLEAAAEIDVASETIRRRVRDGRIGGRREPKDGGPFYFNGFWRIPRRAWDEFVGDLRAGRQSIGKPRTKKAIKPDPVDSGTISSGLNVATRIAVSELPSNMRPQVPKVERTLFSEHEMLSDLLQEVRSLRVSDVLLEVRELKTTLPQLRDAIISPLNEIASTLRRIEAHDAEAIDAFCERVIIQESGRRDDSNGSDEQ